MIHFIDQVDGATSEGRSLAWIEEHIIDPAALDEEPKAALWLYAWVMVPGLDQRAITREHLAHL